MNWDFKTYLDSLGQVLPPKELSLQQVWLLDELGKDV